MPHTAYTKINQHVNTSSLPLNRNQYLLHSQTPFTTTNPQCPLDTRQQRRLEKGKQVRPLSWQSVLGRAASVPRDRSYGRKRLGEFRHQLRTHKIAYFGASHKAWVLSEHSWYLYRATLRSLLELNHLPSVVRILTHFLPHNCFRCQGDDPPPPFQYISAVFAGKAGPAQRIGSGYQRVSCLSSAVTASPMRTAAVPTAQMSMAAVSLGRTSSSPFPASVRLCAPWRTQHSMASIPCGRELGRLLLTVPT